MARIRTIKPEFWQDERIAELSIPARLMFIALWNYADDEGRFEVSPKKLKIWVWPYDEKISYEKTWSYFQELLEQGLVLSYEVDGRVYYVIKNFKKHQVIQRPSKSRLPAPPENITWKAPEPSMSAPESSMSTHRVLNEHSMMEKERNGKGKDNIDIFISWWNGLAKELGFRRIASLSRERKKAIKKMLQEWEKEGVTLKRMEEKIRRQPFLYTKWPMNVDWFIKGKWLRVWEEHYKGQESIQQSGGRDEFLDGDEYERKIKEGNL